MQHLPQQQQHCASVFSRSLLEQAFNLRRLICFKTGGAFSLHRVHLMILALQGQLFGNGSIRARLGLGDESMLGKDQ